MIYFYYDEYGNLKESLTFTSDRLGEEDKNSLYFYFKNHDKYNAIYLTLRKSDGSLSNEYLLGERIFTKVNVNDYQDAYYFKEDCSYTFYKYVLTKEDVTVNGKVEGTIRATNGTEINALSKFKFYIENNVVSKYNGIQESQFMCLKHVVERDTESEVMTMLDVVFNFKIDVLEMQERIEEFDLRLDNLEYLYSTLKPMIDANTNDLKVLKPQVAENKEHIDLLKKQVDTQRIEIDTNLNLINKNIQDISSLQEQVNKNTEDIENLKPESFDRIIAQVEEHEKDINGIKQVNQGFVDIFTEQDIKVNNIREDIQDINGNINEINQNLDNTNNLVNENSTKIEQNTSDISEIRDLVEQLDPDALLSVKEQVETNKNDIGVLKPKVEQNIQEVSGIKTQLDETNARINNFVPYTGCKKNIDLNNKTIENCYGLRTKIQSHIEMINSNAPNQHLAILTRTSLSEGMGFTIHQLNPDKWIEYKLPVTETSINTLSTQENVEVYFKEKVEQYGDVFNNVLITIDKNSPKVIGGKKFYRMTCYFDLTIDDRSVPGEDHEVNFSLFGIPEKYVINKGYKCITSDNITAIISSKGERLPPKLSILYDININSNRDASVYGECYCYDNTLKNIQLNDLLENVESEEERQNIIETYNMPLKVETKEDFENKVKEGQVKIEEQAVERAYNDYKVDYLYNQSLQQLTNKSTFIQKLHTPLDIEKSYQRYKDTHNIKDLLPELKKYL